MSNQLSTPETKLFYSSFSDGEAVPNQDEWLALCERLERERNHWKANHDNQVKINKIISDRPDLAERAAFVKNLIKELEESRQEIIHTREFMQRGFDTAAAEIAELKSAIHDTIMENLHLADGDDCTLKRLKDVINFKLEDSWMNVQADLPAKVDSASRKDVNAG